MNFKSILPSVIIGVTLHLGTLATLPWVAASPSTAALTPADINSLAGEITVRIDGPRGGSGVIVEKRGTIYYVLTNWHVVGQAGDYQVLTPDGKTHSVYYSLIRQLPEMDLAIVPFNSDDTYQVAAFGNSDAAAIGKKVYVAGWPRSGGSLRQRLLISTEGEISSRQPPWNGYTLVYTNLVRSGMSGGPVLDEEGRVIAINGIVKLEDNSDTIVSAGIEINKFLQWRSSATLPTIPRHPGTPSVPPTTVAASNTAPRSPHPENHVNTGAGFTVAKALTGKGGSISSLALLPSQFFSGESDGTISLWSLPNGELIRNFRGHDQAVNAIAISADGQLLVSGSDDQTLKIWQVSAITTGNEMPLFTLTGHTGAVVSLAISPDGQTLVSGSWDNTLKVWEMKTGKLLRTLTGHSGLVSSLAISPDGKTVISGSRDNTIKLWNLQTGELSRSLQSNSLSVLSIAISPDGKTLASGNGNGTISIWNLTTGEQSRVLNGHSDGVWSVVMSRDGNTLISGSWDKTVKLWDLKMGQLKTTLRGHSAYINAVAVSADGGTILSGGWEGEIKIWR